MPLGKFLDNIFNLKVVVELLALLLLIQEVPGSNLGPETVYSD
jgi:hypothetical protein